MPLMQPATATQEEKPFYFYDPSDKDKKTIAYVMERMYKMHAARSRKYNYFNNRSLIQFIDDSTRRWNGYIPPRDDLTMDWQARVFNNFTHNTVVSFLSKAALKRPRAEFVATNKEGFEDTKRTHILSKLYEYSINHDNDEWKFFEAALEAVTKGTVVAYEGYRKIKRKIKEVSKYDASTGKVEYEEKEIVDFNDCYRQVIPLEDFYVSNIWQSDIQEQPEVIWKNITKKAEVEVDFRKYPEWKYVQGGSYTALTEATPFYRNRAYAELESDQVEIIRYYNRMKDQMVIMANGVLLYDGPIPFSHKKYPFAKGIFEPFGIDFFYGKSLPDKIAQDQDVINTLWNMMLDQSYLSIFKPILTSDPDADEETVLVPGLVKKVSDLSLYKVMNEMTGPDASHFNMLQLATKYGSDNSGMVAGAGQLSSPRGGKISARQALLADEQSRQVLGLNARLLEHYERDAAEIRCKNILQFYTLPDKIDALTGQKDEFGRLFIRTIRVDDTELTDGTHGTTVIKIAKDEKSLPTSDELAVEEETSALQGDNVEVFSVIPDYIRNLDFSVEILPESSFMQQRSIQQSLAMEFYQIAIANPLVNQEENTREFLRAMDKDPKRFMKEQTPPPDVGAKVPGMGGAGPRPATASAIVGRDTDKALTNMAGAI